jgi:hypothetical protein
MRIALPKTFLCVDQMVESEHVEAHPRCLIQDLHCRHLT